MKKIFWSLLISFLLISTPAFAESIIVTDETGFLNALTNNTIDTIVIDGSVEVNADGNGDNALVIDRELVITGGALSLRSGGIVLGADVTFKDITLSLVNLVRNGIFANGNTLTINNVANGNIGTTSIHLFCGGVTDYNGTNTLPTTQNDGKIIISGNNNLGNIFAGSFSDIDNGSNEYEGNSAIIINQDTTGTIKDIYACGAYESRGEMQGDLLYPSAESFKVSGDVELQLNEQKTINFDGDTGCGGAKLIYNNLDMSVCMPVLKNISELEVKSGHLAPKVNSNFYDIDAKVSVSENGRVELVSFSDELTILDFVGGGEVVLGQSQTLTILGDITGNTSVGIGSVFNNTSEQMPIENYIYIKAPNADKETYNFTLIPYTTEVLEIDDNGNWTAIIPLESIVVIDATLEESIIAASGSTSVSIPVSVTYKTESWNNMLLYVPVSISVNGNSVTMIEDGYGGFEYTFDENIGDAIGYFTYDDFERLVIASSSVDSVIPDGIYNITMTIPKEYMQNNEDKVLTTKLIVKNENAPILVAVPTAIENINYNGEEQSGVLEGEGYTLEGHKAINAGTYEAIAKLEQGYAWNDTTTDDKIITWEISRANGDATVSLEDWDFGKIASQPIPSSDTNGIENVTYYYKVYGAADATYTQAIPTEVGKYTLKAVFAETNNYMQVIAFTDFNIIEVHTHEYSDKWFYDSENHWHECECKDKSNLENHQPGDEATEEAPQKCTICDFVIKEALEHVHNGGEANCITPLICDKCGELYGEKDSNKHTGETEIRNAVVATTSSKGYTGDTHCKSCGALILLGKEIPKKTSTSGGGSGGGGGSKSEESMIKADAVKKQIIVSPTATVKNEKASVGITANAGKEIIKQALKNESNSVVIEPIIKKPVDDIEVSLASSILKEIANEECMNLVIKTSLGKVEISNEELKTLSEYGKTFEINIANKENKIIIGVKFGDKNLLNISEDIKVTLSCPNCDFTTVVADEIRKVLPKTKVNAETAEVTFSINGTTIIEIINNKKNFEDINKNDWFYNAVEFASARNLFNGTAEKAFSPKLTMSRAMIAQVLYNLERNPEHSLKNDFKDVLDSAWCAKAISWAVNEEIITGYGNGLYGPNDTLTREQLAVMLWKYLDKPESMHDINYFNDKEDISEYAIQAVKWANENEIINGDDKGNLNPKSNATRAEVAQIFKNFIEKML